MRQSFPLTLAGQEAESQGKRLNTRSAGQFSPPLRSAWSTRMATVGAKTRKWLLMLCLEAQEGERVKRSGKHASLVDPRFMLMSGPINLRAASASNSSSISA